jgi:hypothetical protein
LGTRFPPVINTSVQKGKSKVFFLENGLCKMASTITNFVPFLFNISIMKNLKKKSTLNHITAHNVLRVDI